MKRNIFLVLLAAALCVAVSGCGCNHEWVEADCIAPRTCALCEATEGEALGHSWTDATCTAAKTCAVCAEAEGEALGHTWTDATCTEAKTCCVCGQVEGEALGHMFSDWETVKEATCSEAGKEIAQCSVCGNTLEEEVEKLEHTPGEWTVMTEATSTENGLEQMTCTVCAEVIEEREIELSEEEKAELFRSECVSYDYETIARNPDNYMLEKGKVYGKVIQVIEDGDDYTLRVNMDGDYSSTILVSYTKQSPAEDRILEDDYVTMYGWWMGTYTYETVMGSSLTVPLFFCQYLQIN